jgi:hypothetical protein
MYAVSLLEHVGVVLSKSEGQQKWLAPCTTDVSRCVARTIDVCILEKESHRQTKMVMSMSCGIKSTKHGNFGRNICLFT